MIKIVTVKTTILETIATLERERNIKVLYACETGSRAWGFPSPDSDYDVRLIYRHDTNWYLSLSEKKDTIESMLLDGDLDITGWDIRKCLRLLWKSNGALLERLQSPIVYYESPGFIERWKPFAEQCFSPVATMHHYLHMGQNSFEAVAGEEKMKLKKLFYALRAALACEWIIEQDSSPPIVFQTMLDTLETGADMRSYIYELIELKATKDESYLHPVRPELTQYIQKLFEKARERSPGLKGRKTKDVNLDGFFLELLNDY
jgi:uncharacterized protein